MKIDTTSNPNTKIDTNNYFIIDKKDNKRLVYLKLTPKLQINLANPPKGFFWMGMNEEILNRPISTLGLWFFPELVFPHNLYKTKPWVIPSEVLLFNLTLNENALSEKKNIEGNQKGERVSNQKIKNQQKESNLESGPSTKHENDIEDPSARKKKKKSQSYREIDLYLKRNLLFQLRWDDALDESLMTNINLYCLLLRTLNIRKISISSIQRGELSLDIMMIKQTLSIPDFLKEGVLIIEPKPLSLKNDGQFIMYQTLGISLVHRSKKQTNQGYRKQPHVHKNGFDLLVPETILSHRHRRKLRILTSFNSKNREKNPIFCTENNCSQSLNKGNHPDKEKTELIQLKFFLWPNYRLEDLACMNRYWFDTNNGSRFSMLRIRPYPPLKSR